MSNFCVQITADALIFFIVFLSMFKYIVVWYISMILYFTILKSF